MKIKKVVLFTSVILLSGYGFSAEALEVGKTSLNDDFYTKIENYVQDFAKPKNFSLPNDELQSENQKSQVEETFPYFLAPFTNFKITWEQKKALNFQPGDNIRVNAKLSFSYQKKADFDKYVQDLCLYKKLTDCPEIDSLRPVFSDLAISVQVWKRIDDGKEGTNQTKPISNFYAIQNLSQLSENEEQPFVINWTVPKELTGGKYYFKLAVDSRKRFNLTNENNYSSVGQLPVIDFTVLSSKGAVENKNSGKEFDSPDQSKIFQFLGLAEKNQSESYLPFFCVGGTTDNYFSGKIKLNFQNLESQVSQKWEKSGSLGGQKASCFAISEDKLVFPQKDCLKINGEIIDQTGKIVDQAEVQYSCEKKSLFSAGIGQIYNNQIWQNKKFILLAVVIIIFVIESFLLFLKRKKALDEQKMPLE